MRQKTELSRMIARIDKKIADAEARSTRISKKIDDYVIRHFGIDKQIANLDSWLNLYEVSPHLAMRNPHLGIVKHQEQ